MLGRRKPTAHGDTEEAEGHVQRFEDEAGGVRQHRPLQRCLRYTHYGFVKHHLMEKIAQDKLGHLGTDRDHVDTEWDGVSRFAKDFVTGLDTQAETTRGYRDHR